MRPMQSDTTLLSLSSICALVALVYLLQALSGKRWTELLIVTCKHNMNTGWNGIWNAASQNFLTVHLNFMMTDTISDLPTTHNTVYMGCKTLVTDMIPHDQLVSCIIQTYNRWQQNEHYAMGYRIPLFAVTGKFERYRKLFGHLESCVIAGGKFRSA